MRGVWWTLQRRTLVALALCIAFAGFAGLWGRTRDPAPGGAAAAAAAAVLGFDSPPRREEGTDQALLVLADHAACTLERVGAVVHLVEVLAVQLSWRVSVVSVAAPLCEGLGPRLTSVGAHVSATRPVSVTALEALGQRFDLVFVMAASPSRELVGALLKLPLQVSHKLVLLTVGLSVSPETFRQRGITLGVDSARELFRGSTMLPLNMTASLYGRNVAWLPPLATHKSSAAAAAAAVHARTGLLEPSAPPTVCIVTGETEPRHQLRGMLQLARSLLAMQQQQLHLTGGGGGSGGGGAGARLVATQATLKRLPSTVLRDLTVEMLPGGVDASRCDFAVNVPADTREYALPPDVMALANAGVPVFVSNSSLHRALLGHDYPLFLGKTAGQQQLLHEWMMSPPVYQELSTRMLRLSSLFDRKASTDRVSHLVAFKRTQAMLVQRARANSGSAYCYAFFSNLTCARWLHPGTGLYVYANSTQLQQHQQDAISMVATITVSRLATVRETWKSNFARWKAPIVLVVWGTPSNAQESPELAVQELQQWEPFLSNALVLVAVTELATGPHLNEMLNVETLVEGNRVSLAARFPINACRNIAVDNVRTPYVLMVDADFVVSDGAYALLTPHVSPTALLVAPAFESMEDRALPLPTSMAELGAQWVSGRILPWRCHSSRPAEFPQPQQRYARQYRAEHCVGHRAVNYVGWYRARAPYRVEPYAATGGIDCASQASKFEPYFVAWKQSLPRFDERFTGLAPDKISWIRSISLRGQHEFVVVPGVFLVHQFHERPRTAPSNQAFANWERIALAACKSNATLFGA